MEGGRLKGGRLIEVLLYLYCVSEGFGNDFIHEERLQISEASRKQNESIWIRF